MAADTEGVPASRPAITHRWTVAGPDFQTTPTTSRPAGAGPAEEVVMPSKSANVKNEKQYEALKDKGMSKQRAAKIANTKDASSKGGKAAAKKS
jgi:hypothetical protein